MYDEEIEAIFDKKRMLKFCKGDRLSQKMFNDLKTKNPNKTDEYILEVVFNTIILEDSYCTMIYNEL